MADGFSATIITGPVKAAIDERQVRTERAVLWAIRETGRVARTAAKAAAPVYRGPEALTMKHYKTNKTAAGINTPVRGLLRSSIKSGRTVRSLGGFYNLTVAPRGDRVRLYSGKIEGFEPYMKMGYDAATASMNAVWLEAMRKVWG